MFSRNRAMREQAVALDHIADPVTQLRPRGSTSVSWPSMSTRPEVGSISRLIMRSSVDLPAPDVPTTTAIAPASTTQRTSSTTIVSP